MKARQPRPADELELSPDQIAARLVERRIVFKLQRENRVGTYAGVVRSIGTRRSRALPVEQGSWWIIAQRASDPDAASLSARYRGERIVIAGFELESVVVHWRQQRLGLFEFLQREGGDA